MVRKSRKTFKNRDYRLKTGIVKTIIIHRKSQIQPKFRKMINLENNQSIHLKNCRIY